MKQILFSILFATLFVACDKNPEKGEFVFTKDQTFKIIDGAACGSIMYHSKFGNDFDSALDSLIKFREPMIFANTWVEEYYIEKEIMTIDFEHDNRIFYSISFIDKVKNFPIFSLNDVIDSEGNYFNVLWCED